MEIVKKGETGTKAKKVEGNKVVCDHVTLNKAAGQHYQLRWIVDFDGVPQERILELAAETVLIQSRPAFKNAKAEELKEENWDDYTIPVKDISRRSGKSKTDKVRDILAKMSQEERDALLAELA